MKQLTSLIIMAALWLNSNAQTLELKGGLGVNFATKKDSVRLMMKTKHPDATFDEEKNNVLYYQGGTWLNRKTSLWAFCFTPSTKLHTMMVFVTPSLDSKAFDLYDDVVSDLKTKYGEPTGVIENWKYPYDEDDKYSHGTTAAKLGKVTLMTYWKFPNSNGIVGDESNTILVELDTSLDTKVKYQDGILIKEAISKSNEQKQEDM